MFSTIKQGILRSSEVLISSSYSTGYTVTGYTRGSYSIRTLGFYLKLPCVYPVTALACSISITYYARYNKLWYTRVTVVGYILIACPPVHFSVYIRIFTVFFTC